MWRAGSWWPPRTGSPPITCSIVERATAAWVGWWNLDRLHGACGNIPPAEFERAYHLALAAPPEAA